VGKVLPVGNPPDLDALGVAIEALGSGLPVAVPTDTVYALAVDPFRPGASERLFTIKRRSREIDLSVMVGSLEQALELVTALPEAARRLMERFWPGPLTLVLPRRPGLEADLGDDELTVGVRMPSHPVPLALCRYVGPLGVGTAGLQGAAELVTADEVASVFGDGVAVVLDGGRCAGLPATVVDATGEDPHLIREGRLPWSDILAALAGGSAGPSGSEG
jgi:tRNA threonylcarbamoyl adenosine modification protein (Sua5/YciO/YrdC/YwlC family)